MDKGFIICVTVKPVFVTLAHNLLDSIDEYYPDAKVMVSTLPQWEDEFKIYDQVVEIRTDGPNNIRNKLWALQHTPFDKTCYLDADMEFKSERVKEVWDLLDDDHDVAFTQICAQTGSTTAIYREEGEREIRDNNVEKHLRNHGGFFLWHKHKPNAVKAMKRWWELWQEINENDRWWDEHPEYFRSNQSWDQFSWWWLTQKEMPELKIQEIENDTAYQYQWNMNPHVFKYVDKPDDWELIIDHHPAHKVKNESIPI